MLLIEDEAADRAVNDDDDDDILSVLAGREGERRVREGVCFSSDSY